nr:helix-turn-helix transcriptional regulator [uncultured Oscillibacter sp.]
MSEITMEIGRRIRGMRKKQNLTLEELAAEIHKSKAAVSKYERGEISIDIETLYEIADALHIHVEQLLCSRPAVGAAGLREGAPGFFAGLAQFYGYIFDGRDNHIIRCVFDVLSENEPNQYKVMMYMNYYDFRHYQRCETTYYGYMEHYDTLSDINLTNQDSSMEKASCKVLAAYLDAPTKWGLWTGVSSRPVMPIATKILLSKTLLKADADLAKRLKISKEDIRLLKLYNMLPVT